MQILSNEDLELEKQSFNIVELRGVMLPGNDVLSDKRRKHVANQRSYGGGFALISSVMGWKPVNEGICIIRLKGLF